MIGRAPFVNPGAEHQENGDHADGDKARRIFLMGNGIVPDDGLNAGGGKLADKGSDKIISEFHSGQRAERIEQDRREIGDHAGDQHDDKTAPAAVLIDTGQRLAFSDDGFGGIAEEKAKQQKADCHADGFSSDCEKNSCRDAEDQGIGRGENDGRREAQRVDKKREKKAEQDGPWPERGNVIRCFPYISPGKQSGHVRQEHGVYPMYYHKEKDNGQCGKDFDHSHGWMQFQKENLLIDS